MKYLLLFFLASLVGQEIYGQTQPDTIKLSVKDIQLEMLKSPTNPAFILMNTSPSEIVAPASGPEFITSIQNASNDFSALPNNYGFGVTPFWWSKKARHLDFEDDFDTVNLFRFFRTLALSGGIVQGVETDRTWRYGLGFQTTLLRGKVNGSKKRNYLKNLREYHNNYFVGINEYYRQNQDYNRLDAEWSFILLSMEDLQYKIDSNLVDPDSARQELITKAGRLQTVQNELDSLKRLISKEYNQKRQSIESTKFLDEKFNMMNDRDGFKWDIGGGAAFNSENNKIDSTGLYRMGLWTDLGGKLIAPDSASINLSGFFLVRYLYYDEIYYSKKEEVFLINDLHTLDLGGRFQIDLRDKFSLGFEGIYRMGISGSAFESTYKLNGSIQYQLMKNKLIYASFGNNFNDYSNEGPRDFMITFGFNLGFGGNVDVYGITF